ncbi:MAG: long-chain-fatty-acid--CoA ligase [Deferrisomatales bacterium]
MAHDKLILKNLSRYAIGTFAEIVFRNAVYHRDREAFACDGARVTFGEYNARVNRLIHGLGELGVQKGDVVGVLSWNSLEYADLFGAAMKGGFILAPFNPRLKADELRSLIGYSEAKAVFVGPGLAATAEAIRADLPHTRHWISTDPASPWPLSHRRLLEASADAEPPARVEPGDPLFLFFTSGTTGAPKGAIYTHARTIEDTKTYVMMCSLRPADRFLMVMPFFHIGGVKVSWSYFYVGASQVIARAFDPPATLALCRDEGITDVHIVPTHLSALLAVPGFEGYDLRRLKRVFYAASPMPVELLKKGLAALGPIFAQGYGSTETGPNVCSMGTEEHRLAAESPEAEGLLLSCGRPNLGVQVRIVDEAGQDLGPGEIGEIVVRGNTMIEYWHRLDETRQTVRDGWTHSGDMGTYDGAGYVFIVDRKKDMVISGGENVFPREVEEVLYRHPAVHEAAVIGLPDPYWVERVHAVVVPAAGASVTADELIAFCKARLAGYKAPKSVELVASLPKNPAGKILKRELREVRLGRGRG